jgi:putative endonuclease
MVNAGYGGQSPPPTEKWYVYILKCKYGRIYTGCTNDLVNRIKRHNSGQVEATKKLLPVSLTTYIVFNDKYLAYKFERYLKKGSGRAFARRHLY